MCPDPRHFLYLTPLLAIGAVYGLNALKQRMSISILLIAVSGLMVWLSFDVVSGEFVHMLWIGLVVASIIGWLWIDKPFGPTLVAIILVLSLISADYFQFQYNRSKGYHDQKQLVLKILSQAEQNVIVYTDLVESRYGSFYTQYDPSRVRFYRYAAFNQTEFDNANSVYVLENPFTGWMNRESKDELPDSIIQRLSTSEISKAGDKTLHRIK